MARNFAFDTTILSIQQAGENNRTVCFFSAEEGICYATLFGGAKSKLRSLVSPFYKGRLFLYRDESKKTAKITDFAPERCRISFRESLFKTFAASLAAETVIKTKCAGSPQKAFFLFNGFLDGMDFSSEDESQRGLVRFLWRYTELLGIKPEIKECCQCGKDFLKEKLTENSLRQSGIYSETERGIICADCNSANRSGLRLSLEAITYLESVTNLKPAEVRKLPVSFETLVQLKDFCYSIIENACGAKLSTLKTGIGIL